MQLTKFSDLALRVLMYTHAAGEHLVTIEEMAAAYRVSRAHLMKVVNALTRAGYLDPVRGRSGGLRLARRAEDIRLGDVVRATEPDFTIVECFAASSPCLISGCCRLSAVMGEALTSFMAVLDRQTLADVALEPRALQRLAIARSADRHARFAPGGRRAARA